MEEWESERFNCTDKSSSYENLSDKIIDCESLKCFELDKCFGFVHKRQFALQDVCNEEARHQKLYRVAMGHDNQ